MEKTLKTLHGDSIRTITLEEHFATTTFLDGPGRPTREQAQSKANPQAAAGAARLIDKLCDLGDGRMADMDAAGIDMQVLSLTAPGVEQLEADEAVKLARDSNDRLAEAVQRNPGRFAGLASLPTADPETAAKELERVVGEHGFKGAVINGHTRGRYLDDKFFWPILAKAETLQVPIYLHPTPPPQQMIDASYAGNYAPQVTALLSRAAWGWHIETAIHVLRLILSGAFDQYPGLQVVIGHLGEGLPFMMPRMDLILTKEVTGLAHPVGTYLRENIYYTISGFNFTQSFLDLLLQVGIDRIIFSADYPYGSMEAAYTFLAQLPISVTDKERIAHVNAERLLRL